MNVAADTRPETLTPATGAQPWCRASRMLVAAAGGWLGFTVLQRLLSGRWWLWLLPDLLPPLAFVVLPAALLLAVALLRLARPQLPAAVAWCVISGALAAGALGAHSSGLVLRSGLTAAGGGSLRVFAWNTGYWDQHDAPERFSAFLRGQDADVYLLQEYLHWDERAGLDGARQVDDTAALRAAFPGYSIASRGELITLSRYPIVARPAVGPDRDVPPGAAFQEVFAAAKVLRTDLDVDGQVVSVYNVHLPVHIDLAVSTGFFTLLHQRDGLRHRQLAGLSADIAADRHPLLVAGDFNTSPAMGDLDGLRGTLRAASTAGYPASWPAGLPLWRLDWAFTTPAVAVGDYTLVAADGLSDHRGQRLGITLGGQR